ncbi:DUF431-domain-containing protein [Peniophora sp. CONT]|nr:DUF431-domain-containing protein [Peniophora sp. CONT]
MGYTYVVEHMEEDEETPSALPRWVELEYSHMRSFAGPESSVEFTHLSKAAGASLTQTFSARKDADLSGAQCHTEGVLDLMKARAVSLEKVCLLDPKAPKELAPEDGEEFEWFLFGGILGDDPPRDRTGELRALGFPGRHLGPIQMTTDTALGVTKTIVHDKVKLSDIPYVDHPTIVFNAKESVEMPFRYIIQADGTPRLPPGMRDHLYEDLNKSFEF